MLEDDGFQLMSDGEKFLFFFEDEDKDYVNSILEDLLNPHKTKQIPSNIRLGHKKVGYTFTPFKKPEDVTISLKEIVNAIEFFKKNSKIQYMESRDIYCVYMFMKVLNVLHDAMEIQYDKL